MPPPRPVPLLSFAGLLCHWRGRGCRTRAGPSRVIRKAIFLLTSCVTLWIGPALGAVERACLLSWLRQGHSVALYCYARPAGVPDGVEVRDAADILPEERIIRHRSGSVSLFSNWFRYELLRRGLGTWLDTDAYLLRPLESRRPYLIGAYEPGKLNGGVLRMPADSPLLPPLIALFEERSVPEWLPFRARLASHWRLRTRGSSGLSRMPWGCTGPEALTALARRQGLAAEAVPPEILYPVRWQDAEWIRDPAARLEDRTTAATVSIHLWNERIKHFKDAPAPAGSFLARLQAEGAAAAARQEAAA